MTELFWSEKGDRFGLFWSEIGCVFHSSLPLGVSFVYEELFFSASTLTSL